jgi:hypothetical protein
MSRKLAARKFALTGAPAGVAVLVASLLALCPGASGQAATRPDGGPAGGSVGVGPQYDAPHVYVQPGTEQAFVKSWLATFGGTSTKPLLLDVTPTPSVTLSDIVLSPVGTLSVFEFKTGVPSPFGQETIGDMLANFPDGLKQAQRSGADLVVSPFNDPVGRDAVVQFPGGVDIQLWRHFQPVSFPKLATVPQSRVYLEPAAATAFIHDYLAFSGGRIIAAQNHVNGAQIGKPGSTFRQVLISSAFGQVLVIITNGWLPYPFGHESMGFVVPDLAATLTKAQAAGASVLWGPYHSRTLDNAIVQFPGGYITEIQQLQP